MNAPFRPLPPALQGAAQRLKVVVRSACDQTVESLGLAAMSSSNLFQRDGLTYAQGDLARKAAVFALTFNEALDDRLLRELRSARSGQPDATNWDTLGLVDNREVEVQVAAERFGLQIGMQCEWELRELDGYIGPLLAAAGVQRAEHDRNPLRPEVVAYSVLRAIEAVSDRRDVREVLAAEFARTLTAVMPAAYKAVIAELRSAGYKPAGLAIRQAERGGTRDGRGPDSRSGALGSDSRSGDLPTTRPSTGLTARQGLAGGNQELTALMRRLAAPRHDASSTAAGGLHPGSQGHARSGFGGFNGGPVGHVGPGGAGGTGGPHDDAGTAGDDPQTDPGAFDSAAAPFFVSADDGSRLAAPNLIRQHRDDLLRATASGFDHMVIDIVGSLFDQILSDTRVPPQMARQIGRLQLPVLRAALGDASFFSSRKHPVRRFINRLASISIAFEDLESDEGREFLQLVRNLVQHVVDGDFDRADVYENQLGALEAFIADQGKRDIASRGDAAALLARKEAELHIQLRYAQRLSSELRGIDGPEFVRDFIAEVWSQVLLQVAADGAKLERYRASARDLFLSVLPKGTVEQRKTFLQRLPKLMQELNDGIDLIGWPESAKKTFFGALLPAHAASLKDPRGEGKSQLEINLLAKRLDAMLLAPMPSATDVAAAVSSGHGPQLGADELLPRISAAEASAIGLVDEATVDFSSQVDVILSGDEAPVVADDIALEGMPAPETPEPTSGASLADHVQLGIAYQMHHEGGWHKVKLAHVNPARSFFIFTRGAKHTRTISLTHRMLVRMCEAGRLRTFENSYLIERATARARKQLARLAAGKAAGKAAMARDGAKAADSGFLPSRPFLPSQPPAAVSA